MHFVHRLMIIVLVLLTSNGFCDTVVVPASADTFVTEATHLGGVGGTNGSRTTLYVIGSPGYRTSMLVKFDVSAYIGKTVTGDTASVGLWLKEKHVPPTPSQDIALYQSLVTWDESTVTWNNFGGDPAIQADERGPEIARRVVAWSTDQYTYVQWQIPSSLVQTWINNASSNNGLVFISYTTATVQDFGFGTRESAETPRLTFSLQNVAPTVMLWTAMEIGWDSLAGMNYQVQWCTNLASNDWQNLGSPVEGTGGTSTIFDSIRGQQQKFYRVTIP